MFQGVWNRVHVTAWLTSPAGLNSLNVLRCRLLCDINTEEASFQQEMPLQGQLTVLEKPSCQLPLSAQCKCVALWGLDLPSARDYSGKLQFQACTKTLRSCHCSKSNLAPSASLASVPGAFPDFPQWRKLICCMLLLFLKGWEKKRGSKIGSTLSTEVLLSPHWSSLLCTGHKSLTVIKFFPFSKICESTKLILTCLVPVQNSNNTRSSYEKVIYCHLRLELYVSH